MVASHVLQRACEVASSVIAENRPRLSEAERVAQQIVAAARSRSLVMPRNPGMDNTQHLRSVRGEFAANRDLENATVHLEGLVGPQDMLVLLDRALGSG